MEDVQRRTSNKEVLIVGFGIVGNNLYKELSALDPDIYDKYKYGVSNKRDIHYDITFICVDTPLKGSVLDITEVENAIKENDSELYVIKSTCPIGTVDKLTKKLKKKIIFSPEYYGNTQHCNNFEFNFTILGGEKEYCLKVIQVLQKCYDGRHTFRITDSKTAELVKFMENSFLATKVSFCNQFYELCQKYKLSYEELRELFILDKRLGESHTFVYEDAPYWDSHCLNKDVTYIASYEGAELLGAVCSFNNNQKNKYKGG